MSIATYQHDKKSAEKGANLFIIQMPLAETRKMKGVQFVDGHGYTKFEEKAQEFDELFGYEVILPKGHKGWKNADSHRFATADEPGAEEFVEDEEEPV